MNPRSASSSEASGEQAEPLNLFEACCRSYGRDPRASAGLLARPDPHALRRRPSPHRGTPPTSRGESGSSATSSRRHPTSCAWTGCRRSSRTFTASSATGAIDAVATLNQAQVEDEKLKAAFLEENPSLRRAVFALEDHEFLRGSLGAFELDAATFESRATVFHRLMSQPDLWPDLLGALLAVGEYQRQTHQLRGRSCSARTRSATTAHGGSC